MNKELLSKYLRNTCTYEEIQEVEKWILASKKNTALFNQMKTDFIIDTFEETTSEVSKDDAFDRFESLYMSKRLSFSKRYASRLAYAALFLMVLTTGGFYYFNSVNESVFTIPADAITLQLEDGSVKVIEEDGSSRVLDASGNIVGQQQGSQLVYSNEENDGAKKLVYNTLTVPNGKKFELKLSDGTTVNLNSGTSLKYPVNFLSGQQRNVYLTGEAFFGVSKDSLHPFVVNAGELDVRVLGTQFNVSSYPEDTSIDVVLVEGSVGMHDKAEKFNEVESTILKPGFKGSYVKSNGDIKEKKVITDVYTSWIGGELVFRNMTFGNILRKMERHFDVSIQNNNAALDKEVYNASYGKVPLEKVLEDLKIIHNIQYTINGTNIIIN